MTKLPEFNLASGDMVSILLFGGSIKIKEQVPELDSEGNFRTVKSGENKGKIKVKNQERIVNIKGLGLKPEKEWHREKKPGFYSVDEGVLQTLLKSQIMLKPDAKQIIERLLEKRSLDKELGTYYEGFEELLYPDSCIRSHYNHTGTITSRLSSSKPNLQNIPRSEEEKDPSMIKEHFSSRYSE